MYNLNKRMICFVTFFLLITIAGNVHASEYSFSDDEPLYTSKDFTPQKQFIAAEGPACDFEGNLYAVNYLIRGTIGVVTPDVRTSEYVRLPAPSVGNGIRFDRFGYMYIADYMGHNILQVDPVTKEITIFVHEPEMNQPNDLAIGSNDILYASDPDWQNKTGNIWRIDRDGTVTLLAGDMGTTNGIEVSPDDRTLYVNESWQRNIWAFDLSSSGEISEKRLLITFEDFGLDGMRCDVDGNLYVTRSSKGTVAVISPDGEIVREIQLLGEKASNIAFGGPDGKTCYVTMADKGNIETFRTDSPGRSWQMFQDSQTVVETESIGTEQLSLKAAYPNPFNPKTTIDFTISRADNVSIEVFNMTGQKVDTIVNGFMSAGNHSVTWGASGFSAGIYFYTAKSGEHIKTRKMILLK